jgi:hypothetical protein
LCELTKNFVKNHRRTRIWFNWSFRA